MEGKNIKKYQPDLDGVVNKLVDDGYDIDDKSQVAQKIHPNHKDTPTETWPDKPQDPRD